MLRRVLGPKRRVSGVEKICTAISSQLYLSPNINTRNKSKGTLVYGHAVRREYTRNIHRWVSVLSGST